MNSPDKIFLIGLPGSGKSTLGQQVAAHLAMPFIDLDKQIEIHERMSIPEIFNQKGEEYFRKSERDRLIGLLDKQKPYVLSVGGGTPCFYDNMDRMLKSGLVVYLKVPVEEIVIRLERNKDKRPKLAGSTDLNQKINELLVEREPYFDKAQLKVSGSSVEARTIIEALSHY